MIILGNVKLGNNNWPNYKLYYLIKISYLIKGSLFAVLFFSIWIFSDTYGWNMIWYSLTSIAKITDLII